MNLGRIVGGGEIIKRAEIGGENRKKVEKWRGGA